MTLDYNVYGLIILIPFLNFLYLFFYVYDDYDYFLAIFVTILNYFILILCLGYLLYAHIVDSKTTYFYCFNWINFNMLKIDFLFLFDLLSLSMASLVVVISAVVYIYSIDYMKNDKNKYLFLSYLSLFTFFMLIFVLSSNFVMMILGWEGIGICSYLLISFWNTRVEALKAGLKAIIVNRIGDCSFLLAISLVVFLTNSTDFSIFFNLAPYYKNVFLSIGNFKLSILSLIAFLLFFAAICKSAQFGFHIWLADAMEGPTPVSALIHAATMVTAGIYLILRCSYLFELTPYIAHFMVIFGVLTTFFASTVAVFQNDLKKIIAYSTCSQLGYMLAVCGFSGYNFAFFHLINHGFFKALLFLSSGLIIHNLHDEQDIRKFGSLRNVMPLTYAFFFVGTFSLIGVPFLSGYYSKDTLLEYIYSQPTALANFSYHLLCFSAFLTSLYSFRLIYLVFLIKPNGFRHYYTSLREGISLQDKLSLLLLSIFSMFSGFLYKEIFTGMGSYFFNDTLSNTNLESAKSLINYEFNINIEFFLTSIPILKILPLFYIGLGVIFSTSTYFFFNKMTSVIQWRFGNKFSLLKAHDYYTFFNQAWFFNQNYLLILKKYFIIILNSIFFFDKIFLEKTGPYYITQMLERFSINKSHFFYNQEYTGYIFFIIYFFITIILSLYLYNSYIYIL